ncbi:hypothetical protein C5167_029119 [Papaver somniferum]|nr:hypothetical protein C5167_029119 [Papaver somniferum]
MKEEVLRPGFIVPITRHGTYTCYSIHVEEVLKQSQGECEGTASIPLIAWDEEQAEALGALQAIIWAKERNIRHLQLEGDNSIILFLCVCGEF